MAERTQMENYIEFLVQNKEVLPRSLWDQLESMRQSTRGIEHSRVKLESIHKIFHLLEKADGQLRDITPDGALFEQKVNPHLNALYEVLSEIERVNNIEIEHQHRNLFNSVSKFIGESNHLVLANVFVPRLVEALGYKLIPNIIRCDDVEIQIDVLCIRETVLSRLQDRRLDRKEVLAVECKNKVENNDVMKFGKKCEILKSKFEKESEIWLYNFNFESWFVACYGWDNQTRVLAEAKGIVSIDPTKLRIMLRERNLYDPHAIICPGDLV